MQILADEWRINTILAICKLEIEEAEDMQFSFRACLMSAKIGH